MAIDLHAPDIHSPDRPPVIGVIGGSGIYEIDDLEDRRWEAVDSPFGAPSDRLPSRSTRWRPISPAQRSRRPA